MATFSWASAADVGTGVLSAFIKAGADSRTAAAQESIRQSQNLVSHSAAGLAAFVKSINNKRLVERASDQANALNRTQARATDSFARTNFESSVRDAEKLGRLRAEAAARGMGGGSVAAMSQVASLAIARQNQVRQEQQSQQQFEYGQQAYSIVGNAIQSQDMSAGLVQQDITKRTGSASSGFANALITGLLGKKDSLQTLLGSFADAPGDKPTVAPASFAAAESFPVSSSSIVGQDLAPITLD